MKNIKFVKMAGTGNDFIMIDNRDGAFVPEPALVERLCRRRTGIGADGIILLENSDKADFFMRIINSDGSEAEMCGNGARCVARFARAAGAVSSDEFVFGTLAGDIRARLVGGNVVCVRLSDPRDLALDRVIEVGGRKIEVHSINTGVPHAVIFETAGLPGESIVELGRAIRRHAAFAPAGTNVNFVRVIGPDSIAVRTYERGVEDETLACGTGMSASGIVAHLRKRIPAPVSVLARSGDRVVIDFRHSDGVVSDVTLTGAAEVIYEGEFTL